MAGTPSDRRGAVIDPDPCMIGTAPRHRGELARQAGLIRALGSPFVAALLEAGERQLHRAPRTAALIADWPGDPAEAALAMRFNAAIHALARRGASPALVELHARLDGAFDATLGETMAAEDAFIHHWMLRPTQTNEVGRAAAIVAALMVARRRFDLPVELLELGSSAGLNLNLADYAYDLGGVQAGARGSRLRIAPTWSGPPPPLAPVEVVSARGVDLHPLDVADAATRERLLCHVFADQPDRADRLREALTLAQRRPPRIDRGDAATWLAGRLSDPQPDGRGRAVIHSMVYQYLDPDDRRALVSAMNEAGARAGARRPLFWIRLEWTAARSAVQLLLTTWPDGETRQLATCHPYGAAIAWDGDAWM